jgi:hypothetical protein
MLSFQILYPFIRLSLKGRNIVNTCIQWALTFAQMDDSH